MIKPKEMLTHLKSIIGDYEKFAQIAKELSWVETTHEHSDWYKTQSVGIIVDMICFPDGYVSANFPEAFVQSALAAIGASLEWETDYWDMSHDERDKCLHGPNSEYCYGFYVNFREIRLQICPEEHLIEDIQWFAGKNGIGQKEIDHYLAYIMGSSIIELGGSNSSDHTYLAVKDNAVLLIDFGIWD